MKFTVVSPIHNEENMIPMTLPSIYDLKPNQVMLIFDRCTDHSLPAAKQIADKLDSDEVTDLVVVNHSSPDWKFRSAYLRRRAYQVAENDTILNTSADLQLDPKIRSHLNLLNRYKLMSFGYFDYPWTIQCFLRHIISEVMPLKGFGGLLAFSRKAWLETEDLEDLKKQPRAEDTHLQMAISSKYPRLHINTRSLHLRPNENRLDHYNRGQAQWVTQRKTPLSAFIHSVFMVRPAVFTGYTHARRGITT